MRRILNAVLLLTLCAGVALAAEQGEKKAKSKLDGVKCPVSGKAVQEDSTVAYKGAKVYFCCNNCPKAFEANTEKFATKANHQLAATKQARNVKCPLTGKELNKETAVKVAGVKVAFCCGNCKAKVEGAGEADQITLVFSDAAFEKGFKVAKKKAKSE